jgi:hypothetical protein
MRARATLPRSARLLGSGHEFRRQAGQKRCRRLLGHSDFDPSTIDCNLFIGPSLIAWHRPILESLEDGL